MLFRRRSTTPTAAADAIVNAMSDERNREVANPSLVTGLASTDSKTPVSRSFPYDEYEPIIAIRGMTKPRMVEKKNEAMLDSITG